MGPKEKEGEGGGGNLRERGSGGDTALSTANEPLKPFNSTVHVT